MKKVLALSIAASSLFADFQDKKNYIIQNENCQMIQYRLSELHADIIVIKNIDAESFTTDAFTDLYKIQLDNLPNYTFLVETPFEHFQAYTIDQDNFVLEIASSHLRDLIYVGHLPNLTHQEISFLKTSIDKACPFIHKVVAGDLRYIHPSTSLIDLCVKKEVEVSAETDSKGNKSAKGELTIKSDDSKNKASIEYEYKQNDREEKESRAKATIKTEF